MSTCLALIGHLFRGASIFRNRYVSLEELVVSTTCGGGVLAHVRSKACSGCGVQRSEPTARRPAVPKIDRVKTPQSQRRRTCWRPDVSGLDPVSSGWAEHKAAGRRRRCGACSTRWACVFGRPAGNHCGQSIWDISRTRAEQTLEPYAEGRPGDLEKRVHRTNKGPVEAPVKLARRKKAPVL